MSKNIPKITTVAVFLFKTQKQEGRTSIELCQKGEKYYIYSLHTKKTPLLHIVLSVILYLE